MLSRQLVSPGKYKIPFLCQKSAKREGLVNTSRENVSVDAAGQE